MYAFKRAISVSESELDLVGITGTGLGVLLLGASQGTVVGVVVSAMFFLDFFLINYESKVGFC